MVKPIKYMTKKQYEEIKITFEKMLEISNEFRKFLVSDKETKFTYGINKFYNLNMKKVFDEYNEELAEIRINKALIDETTKAIIYDETNPRGFSYDKVGLLAVIKEEKALVNKWNIKEFTVTPYICSDVPKLTQLQEELFKGLVA